MKPTPLIVLGAFGRLGRSILETIAESTDKEVELRAAIVTTRTLKNGKTFDAHGFKQFSKAIIADDFSAVEKIQEGVVFDVTRGEEVRANLRETLTRGLPYVVAVTGYTDEVASEIRTASKKIPILVAPNLSVGLAVVQELVERATSSLADYEVEIVETHHRAKKDRPSGTALALAEAAKMKRPKSRIISNGNSSLPRKPEEIVIHSLRGGDIVGDHSIKFFGNGETIELRHTATSRRVFALGALQAARFLHNQKPGIYSMRDVLSRST